MKRIVLLTGLVLGFAAGTASAQTSVRLSIGFEAPRPYVSGYVLIGRPHVRPVYRPYFHRRDHRTVVVLTRPAFRSPLIVVRERHGRGHRHLDRRGVAHRH